MNDNGSGPELWTGQDPAPARPIPWSEIFEHHISLIEGHIKMMDMVRKHTAEGSGNYKSVLETVERARSMLADAQETRSAFVPLPDLPQRVPLGSPSTFVYPGQSPHSRKRGDSAKKYKAHAASHSNGANGKQGTNGATVSATGVHTRPDGEVGLRDGAEPPFVVDTNPTPIDLSRLDLRGENTTKNTPLEDEDEGRKRKKSKKRHDGDLPLPPAETVDITREVEMRLKEKDEKKRRRQEKKRRRESEKSNEASSEAGGEKVKTPSKGPEAEDTGLDKPRKKKTKTKHTSATDQSPEQPQGKKRTGDDEHTAEDGEAKKKSKRKKVKAGKTRTHTLS